MHVDIENDMNPSIHSMNMLEKHTSTNATDRGEPYPWHGYARKTYKHQCHG